MNLVNGAQSGNVFWQVGSSATLGTSSTLRGNVLALASTTVTTGVTVDGRTLARNNAAVTLDTDTITRATCVASPVGTTTTLISSANPTPVDQPVTFTATVTAETGTAIPTGRVMFKDRSTPIGAASLDGTGCAVFTTSTLTVGDHRIKAVYQGTAKFFRSVSPVIVEVVRPS